MSRFRVCQVAFFAVVLTCGFGSTIQVDAAKPPKPAPPPPPPPPNPSSIYEWRPELGGWLDTQRNLVWGYSLTAVSGSSFTYAGAIDWAPTYPSRLYQAATNFDNSALSAIASADNYQALADAAYADAEAAYQAGENELGDELLAQAEHYQWEADRRYAAAVDRFASADIAYAAAEYADDFTNWRIPTKDEAADACWKGLFVGSSTFTPWDLSPQVGQQTATNNLYWTSTATGKNVYTFRPASGEVTTSTKTSILYALVVRTHVP